MPVKCLIFETYVQALPIRHPERARIQPFIPGDLRGRLAAFCAASGRSESSVVAREIRAQRRTTRDAQLQSEFNTQLLSKILLLVASGIVSLPKEERAANDRQARALCKVITDQALQEVAGGNSVANALRERLPVASPEGTQNGAIQRE